MKKNLLTLIAVLLALTLVFAGCGMETPDAPDTTDNSALQDTTSTPDTTDVPDTTDAPEATDAPAEDESSNFNLGTYENNTYVNAYLGLACTLDDSWTYTPAEQLQALPENIRDLFADSDASALLENVTSVIDMQAENLTQLTSVNVTFSKISPVEQLTYMAINEEQLIDNLLTMKDFLTSSYAQAGMDVTDITKETVTFLGQTHHVLKLSCSIQGMPCYMIQYYDYWAGEYGAVITFSSYLEDKTADLLELFYAVE